MKPNSILFHDTGASWELYAVYTGKRELLTTFAKGLGLFLVRKLAGIVAVNYQQANFEED